jgi:VPDSG-CTERM motif
VLLNGITPEVDQTFTFLLYPKHIEEFDRIANEHFGNLQWVICYEDRMAFLKVELGPAPIPDQGSTFLLLTLGLLGLVTYQRQLVRKQS